MEPFLTHSLLVSFSVLLAEKAFALGFDVILKAKARATTFKLQYLAQKYEEVGLFSKQRKRGNEFFLADFPLIARFSQTRGQVSTKRNP